MPTRYYVDTVHAVGLYSPRADRDDDVLSLQGRNTSGYWSVRVGERDVLPDLAWTYDFPTRQLLPIAGLITLLYNEKVDVFVDGELQERPVTKFS